LSVNGFKNLTDLDRGANTEKGKCVERGIKTDGLFENFYRRKVVVV